MRGKKMLRKILFAHPYILIVCECLTSTVEFNNTSLKKDEDLYLFDHQNMKAWRN